MNYNPDRLTERQREALLEILSNTPVEEIDQMTVREASEMIAWNASHWRGYPATQRQEIFLRNRNRWQAGMNRGQAHAIIAEIKRQEDLTP